MSLNEKKMLAILVSRLPCLLSRLASRLPGVYLWHKGGTPLMPEACQHNHHNLLHLCELSENKRSRRNSSRAFSMNRHPRWSRFFPVVLLEHRRVQMLCQCSQNLSLTRFRQCEVCFRALTAFFFLRRPWWLSRRQNVGTWRNTTCRDQQALE